MSKSIKHLGIKFLMAFLLEIVGLLLVFYLCALTFIGDMFDFIAGCKTPIIIAMFTGLPIGSSIGILIAKRYFLKSGGNYSLCLITSTLFAFSAFFLWPLLDNAGEILLLPIVVIFSLLGDFLADKIVSLLSR